MSVPERTKIGGSLELPRIINGLWQLAGGHDKVVAIASASKAMDCLWVETLQSLPSPSKKADR